MSGVLQTYATALLDLIYTRRCEACESALPHGRCAEARWLCDPCLRQLPRMEAPFCEKCGEPYDGAIGGSFRCGNCADLKLHFECAISAYRAEKVVRELIHRFKYQHELHLSGLLGCLLHKSLEDARLASENITRWTLVPVPLYHARQREREYNQAWELCRALSHHAGIPAVDALKRVRPTTPQASLSRHQRMENLHRAFEVRSSTRLRGQNVLLVDDVLTTGSTTSECARVLRKKAGVDRVVVITVARG
ncbi:MAG: hypothetical protein RL693_1660 [Verrucomicrobiota bacterium]